MSLSVKGPFHRKKFSHPGGGGTFILPDSMKPGGSMLLSSGWLNVGPPTGGEGEGSGRPTLFGQSHRSLPPPPAARPGRGIPQSPVSGSVKRKSPQKIRPTPKHKTPAPESPAGEDRNRQPEHSPGRRSCKGLRWSVLPVSASFALAWGEKGRRFNAGGYASVSKNKGRQQAALIFIHPSQRNRRTQRGHGRSGNPSSLPESGFPR